MYVINGNSDVERSNGTNLNNKLANCIKYLDYF
jgi:hypothetical protein